MYYNLYYKIINKIQISNYKKIALISKNIYCVVLKICEIKKNAIKIIENWWSKHKLPIHVIPYNHLLHCEYLINHRYQGTSPSTASTQCAYYIPNLINFQNVWLMIRYYDKNHYIHFNRNEDNVHQYQGFIIGKTDYGQNFYKLTRNDFLICLKRYGRCIDPYTNIIWDYRNYKRKPIGKIDKYYNILPLNQVSHQ